jgi:hypothetical protein
MPKGISVALQSRIDAIEVPPQPIELGNDIVNFEQHRPHDAEVTCAVLARDCFILDVLGAEGTFHLLKWFPAASNHLDLLSRAPQFIA